MGRETAEGVMSSTKAMGTFADRLSEHPDIAAAAGRIAERYGVTVGDIARPRREVTDLSFSAKAAQTHFVLSLRGVGWSWPAIGRLLGVDHTTAMYMARRNSVLPGKLVRVA